MSDSLNRVLFVDDDELVSELAVMVLEAQGWEVLYCESGQKALDAAPAFSPQLVLLDVLMPEMDGLQTYAALRDLPEMKATPVVFLTGRADEENARQYIEMGALGLVAKPFEVDELGEQIRRFWEVRHG